ncbi:MAG: hypothetical protein U5L45_15035 [Saprospiraceae bacterium]|nr:hypothetical protein [Saprospiraceae bacterium]
MKKITIFIGLLVLSMSLFGQRTDFKLVLNSGLYSFSGTGASNGTMAFAFERSNSASINSHFSTKKTISYGFSGDVRHVSKRNILSGLELGLEYLKNVIT